MKNKIMIKSLLFGMIIYFVLAFSIVSLAETTVYYTATGAKYHYRSSCRGLRNAKRTYSCSLSEAQSKGLSECSICGDGSPGTGGGSSTSEENNMLSRPVFSKWEGAVAYWDKVENAENYIVNLYLYYEKYKSVKVTDETTETSYDITNKVIEALKTNNLYGKVDDLKVSVGIIAINSDEKIEDSVESAAAEPLIHTHDFSEGNATIAKVQSCTDIGVKTYTCPFCGKTKSDFFNSLGHSFKITKQIKSTIFEKGYEEKTCTRCGYVEKQTKPKLKSRVTIDAKKLYLQVGAKHKLKIKKKTKGDKLAKWKTSNKRIATVNKKGVVIGKNKGKATIKLIMKSGCSRKCKVVVE